jgi:hypothetical protein
MLPDMYGNPNDTPAMATYRAKMERRFWIAMRHGEDTPEFFEAVQQEGMSIEDDAEKLRKLAEVSTSSVDKEHFITHVGPDGEGGMEATISFDARAHKEKGINVAIKSLGDRTGDDPESISQDLKTALREQDLGLDDELRMNIATSLAEGDEIEIGVKSD